MTALILVLIVLAFYLAFGLGPAILAGVVSILVIVALRP